MGIAPAGYIVSMKGRERNMCVAGWGWGGAILKTQNVESGKDGTFRMRLQGPRGQWLPATTQAGPALAPSTAIDASAGREELCKAVY